MSMEGKNDRMMCGGQGHGTAKISSAVRCRIDSRAMTLMAKGILQESVPFTLDTLVGRKYGGGLEAGLWAKDVAWKS